ncbi:MAG: hypothetical protein A3A97_02325 [Candidatus Terrybacteria bacterium RIFCSPLOWO2_01_FULL_40_23]|uniref:Uncharacterized protein n=1 Tax=Candidatus Terrybacteria bacterium RIFCSPLOWO2_01_FULL_40_23 TaxID=1802366 RepID=A0A1G2PW47_9BACT|nr:MAG: hypothetical protein A3A97_02325 [Candidatus Terrybacteria bacterium RIFCSPLOWO2_01_FULL_40_23]
MEWNWVLTISLLVVVTCLILFCLKKLFRKSLTVQTTTSRYARESQRRVRESTEDDSRDIGDLMKMSQELYELRPDRVLLKKIYEMTIAGKLEWHVGRQPVFFSHVENRHGRVQLELRKYEDPNEEIRGRDMLALTVEVVGTPSIRIEGHYKRYTRDEEKDALDSTLMDLYIHLSVHYPLNPYISYGRSNFRYGAEEITLEKATDIISSV